MGVFTHVKGLYTSAFTLRVHNIYPNRRVLIFGLDWKMLRHLLLSIPIFMLPNRLLLDFYRIWRCSTNLPCRSLISCPGQALASQRHGPLESVLLHDRGTSLPSFGADLPTRHHLHFVILLADRGVHSTEEEFEVFVTADLELRVLVIFFVTVIYFSIFRIIF